MLSSGSCAKSFNAPFPTKHHCRNPSNHNLPPPPSNHPTPNTTPPPGASAPEDEEPIRVDWHFDWLVRWASPSHCFNVNCHAQEGGRGPPALDLVHSSIFTHDCVWMRAKFRWPDTHGATKEKNISSQQAGRRHCVGVCVGVCGANIYRFVQYLFLP